MPEELQGQLEHIAFYNEQNHYTVAKMKVQGRGDLVTVVGILVSVSAGEVLRMQGTWETHSRYGRQFKVISYETVAPATAEGIRRYLGSGLIKGIGPVMAKRLVDRFGTKTLDVIENDSRKLHEVEGIGTKRIEMIKQAWEEQRDVREVMLFLQGQGVSSAYAAKIYRQYGRESIRVVKENPYRLATDIFGIGFLIADKIASQLGVSKDSPLRAEAGILYALGKLSEEGHIYYPCEPLLEECHKMLDLERGVLAKAAATAAAEGKIIIENLEGPFAAPNNKAVYLARLYASETGIAKQMETIINGPKVFAGSNSEAEAAWAQQELGITLARNQLLAVKAALEKKVLIITGGPGTGKTTIIRAILRIYRRYGQRVALAAPTGRAAKRMSEASGHEAKTIHRLLEFSPQGSGFKRNSENPVEADLVVIDEASMIDSLLMHYLLSAIPKAATVIFVGDADQLPSVGPGAVLKDMMGSGVIPLVRLNEIFRQSSASSIIVNAHRIIHGEFPVLAPDAGQRGDFIFIRIEDPEKVKEEIISLCSQRLPRECGLDPLDDIQVLTPMHRGVIGTVNLNAELQKRLNPSKTEVTRGGRTFKPGDKVMQVRNNYDRDVFNGDVGRIISIDEEEREMIVSFDGRRIAYDFNDLDEVVQAYAISVHKSQGSEYPAVVIPILTQHYLMLQRNLLYTAVTRGKKLVVIVGTSKALAIAIRNNRTQMRHTSLKKRIAALNAPEGGTVLPISL